MHPRFAASLLIVLPLLAACTGKAPSDAELRQQFQVEELPGILELQSFRTEATHNAGTGETPQWQSRFFAEVSLREDTFDIDTVTDGHRILKPVRKAGERFNIYGTVFSERNGDDWRNRFQNDGSSNPMIGRPRGDFGSDSLMVDSPEAATLLAGIKRRHGNTNEPVQTAKSKEHLTVITQPTHARVRILNIAPRYEPNMELPWGNYVIEVSADGFQTRTEHVQLGEGGLRHEVRLAVAPKPTERFVKTGDVILDNKTGLEWTATDSGKPPYFSGMDLKDAHKFCAEKNGDWKLPTINQLASLYDNSFPGISCAGYRCKAPPSFHLNFFAYWSSDLTDQSKSWNFNFIDGSRFSANINHPDSLTLCVKNSI